MCNSSPLKSCCYLILFSMCFVLLNCKSEKTQVIAEESISMDGTLLPLLGVNYTDPPTQDQKENFAISKVGHNSVFKYSGIEIDDKSLRWSVDGNEIFSGNDFSYTWESPGMYEIKVSLPEGEARIAYVWVENEFYYEKVNESEYTVPANNEQKRNKTDDKPPVEKKVKSSGENPGISTESTTFKEEPEPSSKVEETPVKFIPKAIGTICKITSLASLDEEKEKVKSGSITIKPLKDLIIHEAKLIATNHGKVDITLSGGDIKREITVTKNLNEGSNTVRFNDLKNTVLRAGQTYTLVYEVQGDLSVIQIKNSYASGTSNADIQSSGKLIFYDFVYKH